jgi:hypothetical protein
MAFDSKEEPLQNDWCFEEGGFEEGGFEDVLSKSGR